MLVTDKDGYTRSRSSRDERADWRAKQLTAGDALLEAAERSGEAAARILRVMAHNLTLSPRNAALLAAQECPPIATRFIGSWRNAGYRVRKGSKGYLQRGPGKPTYRFAGCDVEAHKGAGPAFRSAGQRDVSTETLAESRRQYPPITALLHASITGYVPDCPPLSASTLDDARLVLLAAHAECCIYCGGEECHQCRV